MDSRSTTHRSFVDLLRLVCPDIVSRRGGRVTGAMLGNLLRTLDPEFSPGRYGAPNLLTLLRSDGVAVGRVETKGASDFVFVVSDGSALETSPEQRSEHLVQGLWLALVSPSGGNAWIDLSNGRWLVTHDVQPEGWAEDSARFLPVPSIPQAEMRAWAVAFAREHAEEDVASAADVLDLSGWFRRFLDLLPSPELRQRYVLGFSTEAPR